MTVPKPVPSRRTDEELDEAWQKIWQKIEVAHQRFGEPGGFPIGLTSRLGQDDKASAPYQVSQAAVLAILAGIDHLHALRALIFDAHVLNIFAPYSILRGALENLGIAYWLIHPVDRKTRIKRTLLWNLQNLNDQDKALIPLGLSDHRTVEEKFAKVEAVATRNGLTVKVGSGFPSTEALAYVSKNSTLTATLLAWRVCSGFAHGRPWAGLGASETTRKSTADLTITNIRLETSWPMVTNVMETAIALMELVICTLDTNASDSEGVASL